MFFALQNGNYISYLHYCDQAYKIMLTCSEELKTKTFDFDFTQMEAFEVWSYEKNPRMLCTNSDQ